MDLTPEQLAIYRESARRRELEIAAELSKRQVQAWELARQAAEVLKRDFSASRVVVFGSLLHPELFHLHSDIDLAAWDVQHYFRAVARLLDLDPEYEFDLVPGEDARPGILRVIEAEGVEL